jgi:hypothetical protein
MGNTHFIDRRWYTARDVVGIVLVYDRFDGYKAYIGSGQPGYTEHQDIQHIMNWGAKFPIDVAKQIFTNIDFNQTEFDF